MAFHRKRKPSSDKVEQQMTPMIDVVFQLLAFFIMTFKVVSPEADFSISMPSGPPQNSAAVDLNLPLKIALKADPTGALQSITVNPGTPDARPFGTNMGELAQWIIHSVGTDRGPDSLAKNVEVELACDYKLHFGATLDAVAAVSSYINPQTGEVVSLY
ncbi:MAG: biopolymer transporter ExbD, partial [Pirellulales bacterium]